VSQAPALAFERSRDDRVIAGVCGGIASALEVDATLVRLLFAFLALAGLNAALFEMKYEGRIGAWSERIPGGAQAVGWCSLVCWAAVIALGRWTAYRLG